LVAFAKLDNITSAKGFLDARFFMLMPILLGIFAALAGSGLLVHDEEMGRLDLLLAYPVSRRAVFFGRLAALLLVLLGILAAGWVGMAAGILWFSLDLAPAALVLPFLSLLAIVLLTTGLALLFSMVLPARRFAGIAAALVLVASFFLTGFARVDESLVPLARLLPLHYFQGAEAIDQFNVTWFAGLLLAALVCIGLACWRFEARDIRVAGEGVVSWRKFTLGSAVAVAIVAVPIGLAMQPKTYHSPEEVFDGAVTALAKEDWETFSQCLTPEAVEEWNARLVVYGAVLHLQKNGLLAQKTAAEPRVSTEQMMSLFLMMSKFRGAMRHVDTSQLKEQEALIQRSLLLGLVNKDAPLPQEDQRKLAGLVKEPNKFLVKALRAWSVAHHNGNLPRLEKVTLQDGTARGEMVLPDGQRREVTFARLDGSWRVRLPFLRGEPRDSEKRSR
jgi:ABC-2 type transport system permease protein